MCMRVRSSSRRTSSPVAVRRGWMSSRCSYAECVRNGLGTCWARLLLGTVSETSAKMATTLTRPPAQVNLDYSSEKDMVDKLRIGLALQPAAIALFANSAFRRGHAAPMSCWRSNTYLSIDPSRCGMLPFVFSPDFGFEAYAEWALDAPMILAYRGGTELECRASSFRDFIAGRMAEVPGAARLPCISLYYLHCSPGFQSTQWVFQSTQWVFNQPNGFEGPGKSGRHL